VATSYGDRVGKGENWSGSLATSYSGFLTTWGAGAINGLSYIKKWSVCTM